MTPADTFPRQNARTQRFTLGAPRNVTVAPDGSRVAFLRAAGPEDSLTSLWVLDVGTGDEQVVADPTVLLAGDPTDLPPEERVRRERARESAAGITGYATDAEHRTVAAALAGQLVVADLDARTATMVPTPSAVIDPRPDPAGERVAWVDGRQLWVLDLDDPASARVVAGEDDPEVRWGVAEFVAAEEMDRFRGYWWAPDGQAILATRVDDTPVQRWWIADPAHPDRRPTEVAYPAAGTPNADVTAWILRLDGTRTEVTWEHDDLPYLAEAAWDDHGPLLALAPARPATDRDPGRRPTVRCHRGPVDGPRRRVGGAGAGHPGPPGGRTSGGVLRRRRSATPRRRGLARHPERPPRPLRRGCRRRARRVHRQPRRRRDRNVGVALERQRGGAAHRRRRRALGGRRRRHGRGAASVARRSRAVGRRRRRPDHRGGGRHPARHPERDDPPRRCAPARHRVAAPDRRR